MQPGNQPAIYTSQPTTTIPIDPTVLLQRGGHEPTTVVLAITFAIWLLRQQSRDK